MKRIVAVILTAGAVAAAVLPVAATAGSMGRQNIVQVASSNPEFSTLVSLVKKAGLVGALEGKSKLTVFAPTNAAFAKVPKTTLAELQKNKALLKKVLLYHVVSGEDRAATVEKATTLATLEGATISVSVKGGHVYVNNAEVVKANVMASNGVIHVINRVLVPTS